MELKNERNTRADHNTAKAEYHKPMLVEYGSLQEYTLGANEGGTEDANQTRMWLPS